MSDLIRREDAIKATWQEPTYADPLNILTEVRDRIEAIPSADRPQGKWIIHYRDKWMVRAECPKCHRRFEFSPRAIWKCCPMCETRMKGADDYERAIEQTEHDMLYEPTYSSEDGSM